MTIPVVAMFVYIFAATVCGLCIGRAFDLSGARDRYIIVAAMCVCVMLFVRNFL